MALCMAVNQFLLITVYNNRMQHRFIINNRRYGAFKSVHIKIFDIKFAIYLA
ncbi:Uncharacterised protein [Serratia entomophila]|nr:Uncharacterised protein [Serratia entomophila]CAI1015907.1 Uncharacterised protein [Serratia entomophila]CAI1017058.1 Uncharacterised protein [Serratia entomophila]CAI1040808.1 Uncharacterised protein [Serratia entomophila]CAI1063408.1 Uncharacterised protein [Serratia entomophila]